MRRSPDPGQAEHLDLARQLVNQPAFLDTVLCEMADAIVQLADSRTRRRHLDHQVRRAPDVVGDDVAAGLRDEHQVRLHHQRARGVEDHILRRNADRAELVLAHEHPQQHRQLQQQVLVPEVR